MSEIHNPHSSGSGKGDCNCPNDDDSIESTPLFVTCHHGVFEVKPTELYVALEQLPLGQASDEALRAYVALCETVIGDLVYEAHRAIYGVPDED